MKTPKGEVRTSLYAGTYGFTRNDVVLLGDRSRPTGMMVLVSNDGGLWYEYVYLKEGKLMTSDWKTRWYVVQDESKTACFGLESVDVKSALEVGYFGLLEPYGITETENPRHIRYLLIKHMMKNGAPFRAVTLKK